jgi:hypothetical protein
MFELGQTVATRGAVDTGINLLALLVRHAAGDWGDLCDEDKRANFHAMEIGQRILSRYDIGDLSFYVITEWDRSYTTIMLCNEY